MKQVMRYMVVDADTNQPLRKYAYATRQEALTVGYVLTSGKDRDFRIQPVWRQM